MAILATATSWAATTGTIKFGTNNVKIDKASVTAADDQGNSWKITTAGTEYFGQQSQYTQVGSAGAPATSITFTTTLSKEVKVSSLSVKFGGFKNTAGTIKLLVGDKEIGTGKLNAKNDVTVTSTTVASGTQLTVKVTNIAKGVKCYNISYTYEDESGKTPTRLSWSAPTATVDLTSEVKEFPTLTKDPESLTGITYSSSNTNVATIDESTGKITLASCGSTTITAKYAGDDTYASSSATYTLRVVDNSIAAGEYTFPINNWFWATNYTGSFKVEKAGLKLQGQQNGISISLGNVNSTNAYVDDNETRTYSSYIMTVNAPEGYVLKKIEFVGTRWQSSTLNASAGNMGAQKIWSGNVSSVEFYFAGICEIKNVKIAYEKAAPAKTLTSIAITGEPAQTEYTEGETFSAEGTCELTFVKKGEGYSIYRDGTEKYKYLYSEASKSGSLKWAVAEQNYWYYDETKGSWAYKVKATETAYLNVYNTNNTFRTYYQAGSTSPVYFAQKVAGIGYADFTTIVKVAEVTTLANLAVNGAEGAAYQVNDEMVVAKKFQKAGKNYIVVKDAAQAVRNFSTPAAGDKFFNINGNKQEEYAQNNWMLVSLPVELYNQVNEKNTVTSITGTLDEKLNVAMTATNVVAGEAADFAPNTYCPINFMGESSVKGNSTAYTSSYYFATPKANEYANVVWAVYNSNDGAFYLPTPQGSANAQEFKAAFKVDYSLNSVDNPELTDGAVYSFEALVKEEAVATTDAKSAPRKVAYDSTVTPSTKFVVYPLDLDATKVATGVNDVNCAKEVKGVSYFNMMGVESAQPFDGVNIMVTTYTDGTQSAAKVLR